MGARGMLARALVATVPESIEVRACSRQELDVTDVRAIKTALDTFRPELVINASGYTAVDRAESDPEGAFAVNASAVSKLGQECSARNMTVVHFSTDYVFDGSSSSPYSEDAAARPINTYGESKLVGERGLLESGARALIVRTQWLFGSGGASFPRTMWQRARARERTRVVADQRGRPTSTVDLARATWQLIAARQTGILHVANAGDASWYELALAIFDRMRAAELLVPCKTADFPRPAARPAYTVLDTARADRALGASLPYWKDSLARFLDRLPEDEYAFA